MEKKARLVAWAVAFDNVAEARRRYSEEYDEDPPAPPTVHRWVQRFLTYGDINKREPGSGRPITASGDDTLNAVVPLIEEDPSVSTRHLSRVTGVTQCSIVRCLKRNRYHPYKPTWVQKLSADDNDRRLEFCQWIMTERLRQPQFHLNIVFSDEAVFHVNGTVNKHNLHYWSKDNTHLFVERLQDRTSVTLWAMLDHTGILAFDVSPQTMNGERYCNVLLKHVIPFFILPQNRSKIFQQDGAPPHYCTAARALLDDHLRNRWMGRRGPFEWPPRSPDLSVCDFFLWGALREKVYVRKPEMQQNLIDCVRQEIATFPVDAFRKAYDSFVHRCSLCIEQEGAQFESVL